jgi:hypothetical protein
VTVRIGTCVEQKPSALADVCQGADRAAQEEQERGQAVDRGFRSAGFGVQELGHGGAVGGTAQRS